MEQRVIKQIGLIGVVLLFFSCGNKTIEAYKEIDKTYFALGTSNDWTGQYLFETDLQKISFITGAYTTYNNPGKTEGIPYSIKLDNSDSKAQTCVKLLKELGCTNIEYIYYKSDTSNVSIVHFTPTTDLKKYFELHIHKQ